MQRLCGIVYALNSLLFGSIVFQQHVVAQVPKPLAETFDQRSRSLSLQRIESFIEPAPHIAKGDNNEVKLVVDVAENTLYRERLPNGTVDQLKIRHLSYNGDLCGPTIRVRPGETLDVRLVNRLPSDVVYPGEAAYHGSSSMSHRLNTTNLHTHGLFVSPAGRSDNVFIDIRPGEDFHYRFAIPDDHPAGTFWYHPHVHGSVAYQVANGMAGALIVEGGVDEDLRKLDIKERILLFQQFMFHRKGNGQPAVIEPTDFYGRAVSGSETKTAINGQITPEIKMRPGEIQRWRLVHAGIWETLELNIEDHDLYEFASDGLTFGSLDYRELVRLQPGNRSDILVQASNEPGNYLIRTRVVDRSLAVRGRIVPETFVAKLVVEGDRVDGQWPDDEIFARNTPPELTPISDEEIVAKRQFALVGEEGPPQRFQINGREFNQDSDTLKFRVGTAEEWDIKSSVGAHPFHAHVNFFEILTKNEQTGNWDRLWRDTAFIPAGQTVKIRTRFRRFDGRAVLHCHILDHEDKGMMMPFDLLQSASNEDISNVLAPMSVEVKGREVNSAPELNLRRGKVSNPIKIQNWNAQDPFGNRWSSQSMNGKPYLLVLHLGIECPHCARQLILLDSKKEIFRKSGFEILTFSSNPTTKEQFQALRDAYGFTLPVSTDPDLSLFRSLDCLDDFKSPLHGTFVVDQEGFIRWRSIGDVPEMDLELIMSEVKALKR